MENSCETSQKIISSEPKDTTVSIKERLARTVKSIAKRAMQVTAIGVVVGGVATERHLSETRTPVTRNMDQDGTIIYAHHDAQTTHILNYLAGREELTYEERVKILAKTLMGLDKMINNVPILPENFAKMNIDQMAEILAPLFIESGEKSDSSPKEQALNELKKSLEKDVPARRKSVPGAYETIWEMEASVGSPTVRFTYGHKAINGTKFPNDEIKVANYDPWDNIVSIQSDPDLLATLIAEFTHAHQFNNNTVSTLSKLPATAKRLCLRATKGASGIREWYQFLLSSSRMEDAIKDEYTTEGSIEYEAHKIIEPEFKKIFTEKNIPLK